MKTPAYLIIAVSLCAWLFPAAAAERDHAMASRLAHTYSIVARDPGTGELGIAVQTHWFAVGDRVGWAEPGVGAVATQSFTDPSYGPLGLDLMRTGRSAQDVLDALVAMDPGREVRQVGMVDSEGRAAAFTGSRAIAEHCHHVGDGFTIHANLMENPTVCDAMLSAYETAEGDLADRMMAALRAAQGEGGDVRGRQSAALKIAPGERTDSTWNRYTYDIRVDDHEAPVEELARLLKIARTYRLFGESEGHLAAGRVDEARATFERARALSPDNHEILFWRAVSLTGRDELDEALPLYARAFELWPKWRTVVERLPASEMLPDDPALIRRILAVP